MSGSESMDIKKIVLKTEPADSFENENCQELPSLTRLLGQYEENGAVSTAEVKNETEEENGALSTAEVKNEKEEGTCDRDCDNFCDTSEKVQKIKRSHSQSDVTSSDHNDLVDECPIVTDAKRSYSHSDLSYSTDNPIFEGSEDQKPSQEELEIYSRVSSELNLTQSLRENVSPLTRDPAKTDGDPVYVRPRGCNRGSSDSNLVTPGVKLCSVALTQVAGAPLRRYTTRLSSRKDTTRLSSRKDTTWLPSRKDTTWLPSRKDTTRLSSRKDTTRLPSRKDTTWLSSRKDTTWLPSRKDTTRLPSRKDTTWLSSRKEDSYFKNKFLDSEIMKPIMNEDGSPTLYQCENCNKVFNKRQTLRQHFITHTDRFACPSCATRCKSKGDLIRHIQTHTKEKPYHCDVCNTDYTRESILKKHTQTHLHLRACYEHNRAHPHNSGENLVTFITTQNELKLGFSCSQCPKVTYSKSAYTKHVRSHTFKYVCNICQKGCKSPLLLKIHKRSHNKSTILSCNLCSRSFASLYRLKEHVKSHRSGSSSKKTEKTLTKADISKYKKTKDSPWVRLQLQPGSKPASSREFQCEECHKTFSSKKHFTKHTCVHDEMYICGVCTMTFPNVSKLQTHLKLHERNLRCSICDMTFYDNQELEDHLQTLHGGGNDYTCRLCYDHFDSASDLERHTNDHNPTMLFSGKSLVESTMPTGNKIKRKYFASESGLKKAKKTEASSIRCNRASGLEEHENDDAPTMLFSGRSLDTLGEKLKSKPSIAVGDLIKDRKPESSSDKGKINVSKRSESRRERVEACTSSDSDDDSILDSQEFNEILNNAVDRSDDNLNDSDISDSDEELYSGIKTVLENEIMTLEESDKNCVEVPIVLRKPLVYGHQEIMKKHCTEFERYSEKDVTNQSFRCKMCDIIFHQDKYLKSHLKNHVCEFCNTFFSDKKKLFAHKSRYETQLLKQIRTEANRLHIPKQKWKGYLMVSSESESDFEDQILNEAEDVLEDEPPRAVKTASGKHSLSHDEIVQANKHLFQKYSCLDLKNNIFACTICTRKYARPTTLTRHLKTHVCQFCNKFFKDKSDLLEHKYSHHRQTETTGTSNKIPSLSFVSKVNRDMFKKYSFIHADRNVFMCTSCNKGFVRRTCLTRHLKTHICSHCDKFFEDKYELVKHITFDQVDRQFSDSDEDGELLENDDDKKPSSVVENVEYEARNITPLSQPHTTSSSQAEPSNRNDRITFIQIASTTTSEIMDTMMVPIPVIMAPSLEIASHPVQVYKNISHQSFSNACTSYTDNKSQQIMTIPQPSDVSSPLEKRDRPYQCGVCGKRFLKNNHLKSHMTIHTGDRPFVCSLCGKSFGRSTILQKHTKTHVKPCKICNATFDFKYELDLHMDTHRTRSSHEHSQN